MRRQIAPISRWGPGTDYHVAGDGGSLRLPNSKSHVWSLCDGKALKPAVTLSVYHFGARPNST